MAQESIVVMVFADGILALVSVLTEPGAAGHLQIVNVHNGLECFSHDDSRDDGNDNDNDDRNGNEYESGMSSKIVHFCTHNRRYPLEAARLPYFG